MRYHPINPQLFSNNRANLAQLLLPNSLALVNANDRLHPSADGTLPLRQNSDLFYLTGIEQEETILLLYPDAHDDKLREILFVRQPNELLATWEGHKLTKEEAKKISGITRVEWLLEFRPLFHRLMCECEHAYLNANEHSRAVIEVESRDARFIRDTQARYPLHDYHRLARLLHRLRSTKSKLEIELLRQACAITRAGFLRVCRFVRPGVTETEVRGRICARVHPAGRQFCLPSHHCQRQECLCSALR